MHSLYGRRTVDIVTIVVGGVVGGNLSQVVFNEIAQEAVGQTVLYVAQKSGANDSTAFILEMAAKVATGSYLTKRIADSNIPESVKLGYFISRILSYAIP